MESTPDRFRLDHNVLRPLQYGLTGNADFNFLTRKSPPIPSCDAEPIPPSGTESIALKGMPDPMARRRIEPFHSPD
jgi:hypothetical protein